jgi:hypothetical protein
MPAHAVVVEIGYITSYAYEAVDVSQVPFWSVNNRALRKNQQTFSCNHLPASASLVGVEDRFSNADGGNLKVGLAFDQGCVRVTDVHKFVLNSDHLSWLQRAQGKKSTVLCSTCHKRKLAAARNLPSFCRYRAGKHAAAISRDREAVM